MRERLWLPIHAQFCFPLLDRLQQLLDLDPRVLRRGHLRLKDLTLLLKRLLLQEAVLLQKAHYHVDTLGLHVTHPQHQHPGRFLRVQLAHLDTHLFIVVDTLLHLLHRVQTGPRVELADAFVALIRPQHKHLVRRHDEIDVEVGLADRPAHVALLVPYLHALLVLLDAGEDAALGVALPSVDVVVEAWMELADHLLRLELACQHGLYELGDLLNYLRDHSTGRPLLLAFGKQVQQQVPPVSKCGLCEVGAGHHERRLEGIFVSEEYLKSVFFEGRVLTYDCLRDFQLLLVTLLTMISVPRAELLLLCLKASGKLRSSNSSFSTLLVFLSDMILYNHSFFFLRLLSYSLYASSSSKSSVQQQIKVSTSTRGRLQTEPASTYLYVGGTDS